MRARIILNAACFERPRAITPRARKSCPPATPVLPSHTLAYAAYPSSTLTQHTTRYQISNTWNKDSCFRIHVIRCYIPILPTVAKTLTRKTFNPKPEILKPYAQHANSNPKSYSSKITNLGSSSCSEFSKYSPPKKGSSNACHCDSNTPDRASGSRTLRTACFRALGLSG